MAAHWWWIVLALSLGALELVSGTFYLLLVALGCLMAALLAWTGLGVAWQVLTATLWSGMFCYALMRYRGAHPLQDASGIDTDDLDAGHFVTVNQWDQTGQTTVQYRGARWQARGDIGSEQRLGTHVIVRIDGNQLILRPKQP